MAIQLQRREIWTTKQNCRNIRCYIKLALILHGEQHVISPKQKLSPLKWAKTVAVFWLPKKMNPSNTTSSFNYLAIVCLSTDLLDDFPILRARKIKYWPIHLTNFREMIPLRNGNFKSRNIGPEFVVTTLQYVLDNWRIRVKPGNVAVTWWYLIQMLRIEVDIRINGHNVTHLLVHSELADNFTESVV